jgi:hypothetical protein
LMNLVNSICQKFLQRTFSFSWITKIIVLRFTPSNLISSSAPGL